MLAKKAPIIPKGGKEVNFDSEFVNLPVRFTYEEDFYNPSGKHRRKSLPPFLDQ
jgi:hypothetical protein